ncbi:MAG TPA: TlpA disulfide reductase family protein [Pirellulales bacterium]|nr:TlpA disulfide reductase family protein [Pirellulales bacterium]
MSAGQQLEYAQTSESTINGVLRFGDATNWTVWVVRVNSNGSWRIIVRRRDTNWWIDDDGKKKEQPAVASLGAFELFPNGRLISHQSLADDLVLDVKTLFPRLPQTTDEMRSKWRDEPSEVGQGYDLAADAPPAAGTSWQFKAVRTGLMDTGWAQTYKYQFSFDLARGLVQRVSIAGDREFAARVSEKATLKLDAAHDADDRKSLDLLSDEMDIYLAACKEYEDISDRPPVGKDAEKLLNDAEKVLKDARAKSTLPMVQSLIDDKLKFHAATYKSSLEDSKKIADMIGKPAQAWEAKDLDGKTHSLSDYRGKVVILDFCHRGCGWCLVSMPHLKKVVDDFNGKQLAVLGISNDREPEDAKFVADKMGLNYPLLLNDDLWKQYNVTGFPMLFVIDQSGIIRDAEVGFTPKLRHNVTRVVRDLLGGTAKQSN